MIVEQSLILQETKTPLERLHKEVHNRIQEALLCIVAAFIGFASLLLASFSRFGSGPQILLAILLLIVDQAYRKRIGRSAAQQSVLLAPYLCADVGWRDDELWFTSLRSQTV